MRGNKPVVQTPDPACFHITQAGQIFKVHYLVSALYSVEIASFLAMTW